MQKESLRIYNEIVDFITAQPSLEDVANFQLSEENNVYIHALLDANRIRRLTDDEANALAAYDQIEHVMTMLKATARLKQKERRALKAVENTSQ